MFHVFFETARQRAQRAKQRKTAGAGPQRPQPGRFDVLEIMFVIGLILVGVMLYVF